MIVVELMVACAGKLVTMTTEPEPSVVDLVICEKENVVLEKS
jgi:hypothetical protein